MFEVARMRTHMFADRHAWRDGRAAIHGAWLELKAMVTPLGPAIDEHEVFREAFKRMCFIMPTVKGKRIIDIRFLIIRCRCFASGVACPSR